ncbi:MAG: hypothetical protein ACE5I0_07330 [Candidatus Binatia bacterium]
MTAKGMGGLGRLFCIRSALEDQELIFRLHTGIGPRSKEPEPPAQRMRLGQVTQHNISTPEKSDHLAYKTRLVGMLHHSNI